MAYYFDPAQEPDISLLRPSVQDHEMLITVAREAEDECIEQYTERFEGNEITLKDFFALRVAPQLAVEVDSDRSLYVLLDGYAVDPAQADGYDANRNEWTGFAKRFRRAIAKVTSHRLRYYDVDPTVESESRKSRSVSRNVQSVNPDWPRSWDRGLHRYDLREGVYHI